MAMLWKCVPLIYSSIATFQMLACWILRFFLNQHQVIMIIILSALNWNSP